MGREIVKHTGDRRQCLKLIFAEATLLMAATLAASSVAQAGSHERSPLPDIVRVAQADAVMFDIPSQPLSSALTAFAEQSGWQLFYSSQITEGLHTAGVVGSSTPETALTQLLTGTGLGFRIT